MDHRPSSNQTGSTAQATIVTVVVDRSGSMTPLAGAVIEGVNELVRGLDVADRVTIAQFDNQDPYEVLIDGVPAAEVMPLRHGQYEPRGGTPLYDAVGTAITRTAGRAREVEIATGTAPNVVIAIVTDGYENASTEYTGSQITRLIEEYRSEGWTVTYVGIGMGDAAFAEGARLGIEASLIHAVSGDRNGTLSAFRSVLSSTEDSRSRPSRRRS
jgi:hypothetical protein